MVGADGPLPTSCDAECVTRAGYCVAVDPDLPEPRGDALPVLALVRDLMFLSRIRGAARDAGIEVIVVRSPEALSADAPGCRLIVDLNLEGALEAAAAWGRRQGRPVAGFVQHVDVERIAAARAAGVDPVVARSAFEARLPALLTGA